MTDKIEKIIEQAIRVVTEVSVGDVTKPEARALFGLAVALVDAGFIEKGEVILEDAPGEENE
jgi:hypothetical protein